MNSFRDELVKMMILLFLHISLDLHNAYSNLKSTLAEEIEVSQNDSFEIATGELKTTVVSKNEELYTWA